MSAIGTKRTFSRNRVCPLLDCAAASTKPGGVLRVHLTGLGAIGLLLSSPRALPLIACCRGAGRLSLFSDPRMKRKFFSCPMPVAWARLRDPAPPELPCDDEIAI